MDLLRQLLTIVRESDSDFGVSISISDKYSQHGTTRVSEEIDNIVDTGPDYVPMQKPSTTSKSRKKAKRQPTTDQAQNSLINTIWFYNNSDAV